MKKIYNYIFLLFGAIASNNANAQWVSDSVLNTKVRDTSGLEAAVTEIVTASNGNSYISWAEGTGSGYEMRMQLVDTNGYNLWGPDGILIDSLMGETLYRYDLEVDDSGNVVMATQDQRSGSGVNWPVAFKVNQQGNMLWGANGIQLTDASAASGLSPVIGFTDSNNVIVAWSASPASGKTFVSFQKISPTGSMLWSSQVIDGTNTVNYERAWIVRTSGEQFIMQYVKRSGSGLGVSTMYAQDYDGQANPLWVNPVNISTKTIGFAAFPEPIPDGYGGFFLTFTSSNPSSASLSEVYAQRVYANGHIWNSAGVELGSGTTQQRFDDGQVYVASQNKYFASISFTNLSQGASGVGLQGIDTAGNLQFTSNPEVLVPLSNGTNAGIIYVTGIKSIDTGLVVLYEVGTTPAPVIIKAVETNYSGGYGWSDTSTVVSAANSDKLKYGMGNYEHGQVVVAWIDERMSNGGVYAQNILGSGTLGSHTCATIVVSPSSVSDTAGSVYNTTLSQTGGVGTVTYAVTGGQLPTGITLGSTGVLSGTADTTGACIFTITATDGNGCSSSQADTFTVSCPVVSLAAFSAVCDTSAAFNLAGGLPAGGVYSGVGVSSDMFHPSSVGAGSFTIQYFYTVGNCMDTATQSIIVNHCSGEGVKNVTKELLAECVPNPSNGLITIKLDEQVSGTVTIKVMDMEGRVIFNSKEAAVNGIYSKTVDMTKYPKGIYLVQIGAANGIANMKIDLQ